MALEARKIKSLLGNYKSRYIKYLIAELERTKDIGYISDNNIIYVMQEDNPAIWYGLIFNLGMSELSGEYILELIAQDDYPNSPPKFKMLTPNGVFDVSGNATPCLNIGHLHASNYPATLGMQGFGAAVVGALQAYKDLKGGLHIISTTINEKKELSKKSVEYNTLNHQHIMEQFRDHVITYGISPIVQSISFVAEIICKDE